MILLKRRYSTATLFVCLCVFRLGSMQALFPPDATLLSGPSGEITSPGYPNTIPGLFSWNITADEEHRIILQFLDFEAVERNPCTLDNFELFDGEFLLHSRVGRWCWDSFDQLTVTTFTSRSNVFLLRFRALEGYERKGFKANYSIIPGTATTTITLSAQQTATTNAVLGTYSTSAQYVSTKSPTASDLSTTPTSGFPQSTKTSTRVGAIAVIATCIIIAIAIILSAALFLRKYKKNNRGKNSSKGQPLKSFTRGNISTDEYAVVEKENDGVVESKYENINPGEREENSTSVTDTSINVQKLGINTKEVVRHHEMDTPDGTYEKPDVYVYSHPDPNEMKFCIKQ